MNWFEKIFKSADTVAKDTIEFVEKEFKELETRVSAIEQHLIGGKEISVPPQVTPAVPVTVIPASTLPNPTQVD